MYSKRLATRLAYRYESLMSGVIADNNNRVLAQAVLVTGAEIVVTAQPRKVVQVLDEVVHLIRRCIRSQLAQRCNDDARRIPRHFVIGRWDAAAGFVGATIRINGYGGPDGLRYLRGLDVVDKDNIGLEGHSMGGWAVLAAAAAMPDSYKAMVLEGSATGVWITRKVFAAPSLMRMKKESP